MERQNAVIFDSLFFGLQYRAAIVGAVVSKPTPMKTTVFAGFS